MSKLQSMLVAGLTLSAAFAIAAPAAADPRIVAVWNRDVANTRRVPYVEADLVTPEGAKALASRLRRAAGDVCGGDSVLVLSGARFHRCRREAVERATEHLDAPLLSEALGLSPHALARR